MLNRWLKGVVPIILNSRRLKLASSRFFIESNVEIEWLSCLKPWTDLDFGQIAELIGHYGSALKFLGTLQKNLKMSVITMIFFYLAYYLVYLENFHIMGGLLPLMTSNRFILLLSAP